MSINIQIFFYIFLMSIYILQNNVLKPVYRRKDLKNLLLKKKVCYLLVQLDLTIKLKIKILYIFSILR